MYTKKEGIIALKQMNTYVYIYVSMLLCRKMCVCVCVVLNSFMSI